MAFASNRILNKYQNNCCNILEDTVVAFMVVLEPEQFDIKIRHKNHHKLFIISNLLFEQDASFPITQ